MPLFTYKAQYEGGTIYSDTIQASSKSSAAQTLKSQGIQVFTIKKVGGFGSDLFGGISVSEKAAFCRFMATMLRSGMSLPEGVEIIRAETKNARLKKILADVSYQTKKGKTISSVLANYKDDFDPVFLTMVRVGEESGTLEQSFDYLAKQLSTTHELSEKIKGSLMYPAVIVVAMFGNGLLMGIFVLPRLSAAFLKLDVPLPFYTKILLNVGQFFGNNQGLVIFTTLAIAVTFFSLFIIKPTRSLMIKSISTLPVVRNVVQHIDIARYSRTLATLLRNGVPIIEALDVSAASITRPQLQQVAKGFSKGIASGQSLSDLIIKSKKYFPSVMVQTIKAGEQSGTLESVLDEIADFYEKEVEFSLKKMTSLIEPVLMLVIGVAVGAMVVIMIAPIYSIITGLQATIAEQ